MLINIKKLRQIINEELRRLQENSQQNNYDVFREWIKQNDLFEVGPDDAETDDEFPRYAVNDIGDTYVGIDENGELTIVLVDTDEIDNSDQYGGYVVVMPEQLQSITPEDIDNGWRP